MSDPTSTEAAQRELDRVGAFSDGVFAIAITLLVLNLEVPDVPGKDLGSVLSDLSDDLLAYAIGFAVMGLFWFRHHKLFSALDRATPRLVVVNLALLATIALMPFTTGLLGRFDEPLAVALYAGDVAAAIVLLGLTGVVADPSRWREIVRSGVAPVVVFLGSIPVAYAVSESAAKWCWLLLLVTGRVERLVTRSSRSR